MKIEIKKIGNSDGLLLPRELMQRLDLKRGQELHITELPGGGFQALPYDPDFEKTMEMADQVIPQHEGFRGGADIRHAGQREREVRRVQAKRVPPVLPRPAKRFAPFQQLMFDAGPA